MGTVFALRPSYKNHVLMAISFLAAGIGAGIGRFFEMLIPGIVLGLVLGYGVYYVWKDHTAKSESKNLESL